MAESLTVEDVAERFNEIDGIESWVVSAGDKALVKVVEESSVGQFFGLRRRLGIKTTHVTRDGLPNSTAVLDAWAYGDE